MFASPKTSLGSASPTKFNGSARRTINPEGTNNLKKKFLNELFDLIRIPSISAVKEYKGSVREAAEFLKNQFENASEDIKLRFEDKVAKIQQGDDLLPTVMKVGKVFVEKILLSSHLLILYQRA